MKILHITDSHGTVKSPEGRRDIYYITFLKKMYELGFVCKKLGINMVIHTGDLFHTARVSNKFAGQVSEMIKAMGVPFYVVPGNHDIDGYTTDTIDQTMLGLLAKAGVVKLLDREHPVGIIDNCNGEEYTIAISGQEYYAHIDEGNPNDFDMQQEEADLNILAIHGYIADTPQHPSIKCTMAQDVVTNADIILTGHYHRSFHWFDGNSLDIYNPGSMMRVEQTDYNKTHMPTYGILDIRLNERGEIQWDYNFHEFKVAQPSTVVFDYEQKHKQKIASITLEGFKNSLATTMASLAPTSDILKIISDLCQKNNIDKSVEMFAVKAYNDTLQSIPDEFEAPPGYIEAHTSKKISSVHLVNFQSHKDTTVNFSDGLNIIVGESNNGKTAIMRAIMWVVDNQPLGSDFIMAGQDDCVVRITYDDGTYIERGRTRKDTGYYEIRYIDENGNFQMGNYRGFTNAVPIEVINNHQMPKVNITKDIETHLNVLSQLDSPFLLTESPQVKAAAIGRITGVHVIDAAVKENNKEVRSNKILMKEIEKDKIEQEIRLKQLPDLSRMEKALRLYNSIIAEMKARSFIVEKLIKHLGELDRIAGEYDTAHDQYVRCASIAKIRPFVVHVTEKFTQVQYLESKVVEYNMNQYNISRQEEVLDISGKKMKLGPVISKAESLYEYITRMSVLIGEKKMLDAQEIVSTASSKANWKANDILDRMHTYLVHATDYVHEIDVSYGKYKSSDAEVSKQDKICKGCHAQVKALNSQVQFISDEKTAFIISYGVCPCCGQAITKEHADHINTFMEEQRIG